VRHLRYGACSGQDRASLPGGFHARPQPAYHLYASRGSIAHGVGCRRVRFWIRSENVIEAEQVAA